jgi:hypothetical protein
MEADDHEEEQAHSENEAWPWHCWWMGWRCWEQMGEYLSKMAIVTIFFFILLAINGGNVFAFVTRGVHQLVGIIFNKGGIVDWLCRMTEGFSAVQTCKTPNYNQKRPNKCTT